METNGRSLYIGNASEADLVILHQHESVSTSISKATQSRVGMVSSDVKWRLVKSKFSIMLASILENGGRDASIIGSSFKVALKSQTQE